MAAMASARLSVSRRQRNWLVMRSATRIPYLQNILHDGSASFGKSLPNRGGKSRTAIRTERVAPDDPLP
jgi:hypothetical protein